jgi:hypothetical protein
MTGPSHNAAISKARLVRLFDPGSDTSPRTGCVKGWIGRMSGRGMGDGKILAAEDDMGNMETSFKQDVFRMESSLHLSMSRLEAKIDEMKSDLLRWMFILWVAQVAATGAIVFWGIRLLK